MEKRGIIGIMIILVILSILVGGIILLVIGNKHKDNNKKYMAYVVPGTLMTTCAAMSMVYIGFIFGSLFNLMSKQ